MYRLKHILKGFAKELASFFSNLGRGSSGPVYLLISSLFNRPKRTSFLMVTLSSVCVCGGFVCTDGKGVKRYINCHSSLTMLELYHGRPLLIYLFVHKYWYNGTPDI